MEKFAGCSKDDILKEALTCQEAKKVDHPMTQCMDQQGKHFTNPAGGCMRFLKEVCDLTPGKDFGQGADKKSGEIFAGFPIETLRKKSGR